MELVIPKLGRMKKRIRSLFLRRSISTAITQGRLFAPLGNVDINFAFCIAWFGTMDENGKPRSLNGLKYHNWGVNDGQAGHRAHGTWILGQAAHCGIAHPFTSLKKNGRLC
ncbi:uncharacterized protein LOC112342094 [Selaginella moellendorffii]|uniref:uncharacterized protein LOC112342063 n=1 Tax=Selaginella moellendorffii TaxID=88036 RepID=UPI000D1CD188|nr:uncharacterized protein LOC112342063 [Selaginella moellendorffii]XP_024519130.1 uncharacterized protein LOC112342094 [Selaginella moellendorffii]|eukprot:XP_024519042.1 uncharacterized protein LOC112342063 [Selaginella moellendorffii]